MAADAYAKASALARVAQVDEIVAVHSVGYDGDGRNETKGEALIELVMAVFNSSAR
jgi:hypothetical protein